MLPTSQKFEPAHVLVALPFSVTKGASASANRHAAASQRSHSCSLIHHEVCSVLGHSLKPKPALFFINAKDAAPFRRTLIKLGHPQGTTPIQTNRIINDTVKQCCSKAMDIRFYWINDRVAQGQYVVHWRKGSNNLTDHFTKQPSPSQHCLMRLWYLVNLHRPASLQGCVEPAALPLPG